MARWQPETAERLQRAALELFASHGFEQTTASEIARSVGLSERTFFRHFADKREVLFDGQDVLVDAFLSGIADTPAGTPAFGLVAAALRSGAAYFPAERRPFSRTRQRVIDQHPALQERERHKLASLADTLAGALRDRGVPEPTATLAAESGTTVFGIAFGQWIADGEERSLAALEEQLLAELQHLTAP